MGRISSRPIIMHRDMTALDSPEKAAKLPLGPIISRPGPTLLTQVRAALKETEKEKPSSELAVQLDHLYRPGVGDPVDLPADGAQEEQHPGTLHAAAGGAGAGPAEHKQNDD